MAHSGLLATVTVAAVCVALLTVAASAAGLRLFPNFRSREQKTGEYRRDTVSAAAASSSRLPCVVGPAMLIGLTVVLAVAAVRWPADRSRLGYVLALCWAEWLLGWLDDLRKARGMGLGERVRLLAHAAIAVAAALAYVRLGFAGSVGFWQQLGSALVVLVALLYLVLSAGFSDGVDGLTSGLTVLPCLGFTLLGVVWGDHALGIGAGAATGMALGALLMNAPSNWTRTGRVRRQARGYIGDSGALLAGAVVAGLAISVGAIALLPLLAAGFVLEGGTVFLQTGLLTPLYRRGLRLQRYQGAPTFVPHTEFPLPFLATPLHHHLNLIGLKPLQVVAAFWVLQIGAGAFGLAAALLAPPLERAACWAAGVLVVVLVAGVLAGTRSLFLDIQADGANCGGLAIKRGLPFGLWRFPLYRLVEEVPDVPVPGGDRGWLGRPLHRYDALCRAAMLAEAAGQPAQASALLRRVPALNLMLRPEAALLLAAKAAERGELAALLDDWRRVLRPVFQEGRLDLVLDQLAALALAQGDAALARALSAQRRSISPGAQQPIRWR